LKAGRFYLVREPSTDERMAASTFANGVGSAHRAADAGALADADRSGSSQRPYALMTGDVYSSAYGTGES
jgi:hypothetical protein